MASCSASGPGQQHAEVERARELLFTEPAAPLDDLAVHHRDLSCRATERDHARCSQNRAVAANDGPAPGAAGVTVPAASSASMRAAKSRVGLGAGERSPWNSPSTTRPMTNDGVEVMPFDRPAPCRRAPAATCAGSCRHASNRGTSRPSSAASRVVRCGAERRRAPNSACAVFPELALLAGAARGDRGRHGERVHRQRQVARRVAHLAGVDVVARSSRERSARVARAVRALQVAELDDRDRRVRAAEHVELVAAGGRAGVLDARRRGGGRVCAAAPAAASAATAATRVIGGAWCASGCGAAQPARRRPRIKAPANRAATDLRRIPLTYRPVPIRLNGKSTDEIPAHDGPRHRPRPVAAGSTATRSACAKCAATTTPRAASRWCSSPRPATRPRRSSSPTTGTRRSTASAAPSATSPTRSTTSTPPASGCMEHGVTINRPPRDGRMAFVRSPDNISIELLQKGGALPPAEPWPSMPNTGRGSDGRGRAVRRPSTSSSCSSGPAGTAPRRRASAAGTS